MFLLNIFDHSSYFSFKLQKLITTASPTLTTQESRSQKDRRLLVTSSPSRNDNETLWFAPKSLLDAAIKILPTLSPLKKIYPSQLSITIGKWNFRNIPSNQEYLPSEGKITCSLKEVSMRFRKRICGKYLTYSGKRIFKNLKRIFKFLKRNKLQKPRKPKNFVPITWSIWQAQECQEK